MWVNCRCISTPPIKKKKVEEKSSITNTFHLPALGLSTWGGGEGEERGTLT